MGKPKVRYRRRGNGDRPGSREFWIHRTGRRAAQMAAALVVVAAGATVGVAALEQDHDATLVLDAPAEGVLDRGGVGVWTLDGSAGTTVSMHVDGSNFDPVAHLWSPTGELVGTADDGGGTVLDGPLVTNLPLSGRYRIEVRSVDGDGRGDYAVAVRTVRKVLPNVSVRGGTRDVNGRTLRVEVWTFDGRAGLRVHVGNDTPVMSLRSPLGKVIDVDYDDRSWMKTGRSWMTAILPSTGKYQIRVFPFEWPYEIVMHQSHPRPWAENVENDDAAGLPYSPEVQVTDMSAERNPPDGEVFRDCDFCPGMVVIPAGMFRSRREGEGPHVVTLKSFALGVTEVTFDEWNACVRGGGCSGRRPYDEGWVGGALPVINVTQAAARVYARWLSRETGQSYRLPSDTEWEYAARGGWPTSRYWDDSSQCEYENGSDVSLARVREDRRRLVTTRRCIRRQWVRIYPTRSGCSTCWGTCAERG